MAQFFFANCPYFFIVLSACRYLQSQLFVLYGIVQRSKNTALYPNAIKKIYWLYCWKGPLQICCYSFPK